MYLDNLKVHHTHSVVDLCNHLNIRLVFAPIYSSQFNPIERLWALAKQNFRQRIAIESDLRQSKVQQYILESISSVPRQKLEKHTHRCLAMMYRAVERELIIQ